MNKHYYNAIMYLLIIGGINIFLVKYCKLNNLPAPCYQNDINVFRLSAQGDLAQLRALCKNEKLFQVNSIGRTPIFYAANPEVIEFFIDSGIDVNSCIDNEGCSLLEVFCMDDKLDNVKKILPLIKDINHQDEVGGNALIWAVLRGNYNVVQLLLEAGADPTLQLSNGMTVFEISQKNINRKQEIIDIVRKYFVNLCKSKDLISSQSGVPPLVQTGEGLQSSEIEDVGDAHPE